MQPFLPLGQPVFPALEVEPLLTLLRRFVAEAAREEARLFCDELVAA